VRRWQVEAGLIYGQVKKCYRRRKLVRVSQVMHLGTEDALKAARPRIGLLWTTQHRFHRTGQSDHPPWNSRAGTPHLGHFPTGSTASGPSGVVASVLSCCPSPCLAAGEARAAARTRGQPAGAMLPTPDSCDGSRQNSSTMDGARGALVPLAKGFRLRGSQARWGAVSCRGKVGEGTRRGARMEPHSGKGRHFWTASSHKTGPKWVCRELVDLSTMSDGSTSQFTPGTRSHFC
jgi:hypothetical protein